MLKLEVMFKYQWQRFGEDLASDSLRRRNCVPGEAKKKTAEEGSPQVFPSLSTHSWVLPCMEEQKERLCQSPSY